MDFERRPFPDFGAARALHGMLLPQAKRRGVPKSNQTQSKNVFKNRGRNCIDDNKQKRWHERKSMNRWSYMVNFGFGTHSGPKAYI